MRLPWEIAESIAVKLAASWPRTVRIVGDATGRVTASCQDVVGVDGIVGDSGDPLDGLVWVGDGSLPSGMARRAVLSLAAGCRGVVVVGEPVVPGAGLGRPVLRRIDPYAITRHEWVVAAAAAWRFRDDAEVARAGLLARVGRMDAAQMVVACRRLMERFECAHETFVLCAETLAGRGDVAGAGLVVSEMERYTPLEGWLRRGRLAVVAAAA